MKAALVLDGIGFGGIERVAIGYARIFLELGYEVDVYNLKPGVDALEKEFPQGCTFISKPMPEILLSDRYMLMVKRWRWGKYLYPVVYLGTFLLMNIYKMTMGKRKEYDIGIAFSGHFRDLSFVAYDFIKSKKKMCWLHGSLISYLILSSTFGDLYRRIRNLCTLSDDNEKMALESNHFLKSLNLQKIYNPIDKELRPLDEKVVESIRTQFGDYLLMIGRFDKDKDQKTVIYAMKELIDKYKISENLVFVGDGPALEDCRHLVKRLQLDNRIYFTGARYDVQNFYSTAKLFIHSSPAEGLPTVLLEAMKYGLPIVATDSPPGVNEILKDSEYGVKCGVGDVSDMAEKIAGMLSDPAEMEMYRKRGKERVQDFAFEAVKDRLRIILSDLK